MLYNATMGLYTAGTGFMLNKTLCGYCLYRELQKRYLEQFSDGTVERTATLERRIKKRLQMHERYFSKWFQKVLKKTHGLVPCLCGQLRVLNYEPLDLMCSCSEMKEAPENCQFILEHTLAINDKKKGKNEIE